MDSQKISGRMDIQAGADKIAIVPDAKRIAFQQGLIFGLGLAVLGASRVVYTSFVADSVSLAGLNFLLETLLFFLGLGAYFVAGMRAAHQSGKVSTGVLAGLWTGGWYAVSNFLLFAILYLGVVLPRITANFSDSFLRTQGDTLAVFAIIGGVIGLFFAVGLGAGVGALGGLAGKSTSKVVLPPAYPPYPAYPPVGYVYPAPPYGYPPQPYGYATPSYPYPPQAWPAPAYAPSYSTPLPPYAPPYGYAANPGYGVQPAPMQPPQGENSSGLIAPDQPYGEQPR